MADIKHKLRVPNDGSSSRGAKDGRDRNVWQWKDASIDIDSTTILLRQLENDALELEVTQNVPGPDARVLRSQRRAPKQHNELTLSESMQIEMRGGFDPYNSSD